MIGLTILILFIIILILYIVKTTYDQDSIKKELDRQYKQILLEIDDFKRNYGSAIEAVNKESNTAINKILKDKNEEILKLDSKILSLSNNIQNKSSELDDFNKLKNNEIINIINKLKDEKALIIKSYTEEIKNIQTDADNTRKNINQIYNNSMEIYNDTVNKLKEIKTLYNEEITLLKNKYDVTFKKFQENEKILLNSIDNNNESLRKIKEIFDKYNNLLNEINSNNIELNSMTSNIFNIKNQEGKQGLIVFYDKLNKRLADITFVNRFILSNSLLVNGDIESSNNIYLSGELNVQPNLNTNTGSQIRLHHSPDNTSNILFLDTEKNIINKINSNNDKLTIEKNFDVLGDLTIHSNSNTKNLNVNESINTKHLNVNESINTKHLNVNENININGDIITNKDIIFKKQDQDKIGKMSFNNDEIYFDNLVNIRKNRLNINDVGEEASHINFIDKDANIRNTLKSIPHKLETSNGLMVNGRIEGRSGMNLAKNLRLLDTSNEDPARIDFIDQDDITRNVLKSIPHKLETSNGLRVNGHLEIPNGFNGLQRWNENTVMIVDDKDGNWTGMKNCPDNKFVCGLEGKDDGGITALKMKCCSFNK